MMVCFTRKGNIARSWSKPDSQISTFGRPRCPAEAHSSRRVSWSGRKAYDKGYYHIGLDPTVVSPGAKSAGMGCRGKQREAAQTKATPRDGAPPARFVRGGQRRFLYRFFFLETKSVIVSSECFPDLSILGSAAFLDPSSEGKSFESCSSRFVSHITH